MNRLESAAATGLYRPEFEHDNCGFGLIAHIDGEASHALVDTAIKSLARLTHRGAVAADGKTGDGCGLLLRKPKAFLQKAARNCGFELSDQFAVGNVFLSHDNNKADLARNQLNAQLAARGLEVAGWRKVPINPDACGVEARESLPQIEQVFVNTPTRMKHAEFNRHLFVARRKAELAIDDDPDFYICTLASNVILYKGLIMPDQLPVFYPDLSDPDMASSIAVFHQRFSTNTLPQWKLAQPFRYLAHNGEINTIQGNRNWARARAHRFRSDVLPELNTLHPIVSMEGSDSSSLDNMLEVLLSGGIELFRAVKLLVPPAWQHVDQMDHELRAFLEYNSMHMEPWDGPAGLVLTDGRYACCALDRNGLRPARYVITRNRFITLASEVGVHDYSETDVMSKGRLRPGEMLAVDTDTGAVILPREINNTLKTRQPYAKWLSRYSMHLRSRLRDVEQSHPPMDASTLAVYEKMFGVTFEERDQVLRVLSEQGQEAVGSMGDDSPFPVLSRQHRSLFDYFRQQFAQVTNPPIDPLRESIVMSLDTCIGREHNMFDEQPEFAKRLLVRSPVLSREKFETLLTISDPDYAHERIDLNYDPTTLTLEKAIIAITNQAVRAIRDDKVVLVISDRELRKGMLPVPALLATGAIHHRLIDEGLRCRSNIMVETGCARDPHHMAVLVGYGATCIYPYLAYESIQDMSRNGEIEGDDIPMLEQTYRTGLNKALLKIMSKMGISMVSCYRGAQLFEAVGLSSAVVDLCFKGTTSRVQGTTFEHLEADLGKLARTAWNARKPTSQGGLLKYIHGGEYHAYNPDVVQSLQQAVTSGEWQDYKVYADLVNNRPIAQLRDLMKLREDVSAIALDEVEPIESFYTRFDSAGMSLGALSPEAHETLAEAMNRLGGRSNSGEGGEDKARYGNLKMSKIKQVASGRFGVTPHYLVNAEVLQIKIAQGAKPGEGGQLPGHKVDATIARLRHSMPGVALISPPPHHDIYSIEDLAQLIFDLKQINPQALVSVKLVAAPGVGTVAAGVAKAYADLITISGYDGGTGASPLSSVKYAGCPWELGLSETHQVLRANNLRDKVRIQTDGGLKTGLDVIKAAILGAESFGFGTGPMIAMGCKFLRICHLNNCATGVATQHKVLRMRHFNGNVEKVMNYFRFVAEDTRRHMAQLGVRSIDELIGRTDLLEVLEGDTDKQRGLDLAPVLSNAGVPDDAPRFCTEPKNEPFDKGELAEKMVSTCRAAIDEKTGGVFDFLVQNTDRSIGARLSGEIARAHGDQGLNDAPITLNLTGTAGQSFGVWNAAGLNMTLTGDANDYVGKGMSGGKLVLRPPQGVRYKSHESAIMGNTCLYGATGGRLFAAGQAGERFGVRNSGAQAVVEGVGDHGAEYMTGGSLVVLGETGGNFGAGMTGGFVLVLDMHNVFVDRYNHELIDIQRIFSEPVEAYKRFLHDAISEHVAETGSIWGEEILDDFYGLYSRFWLVKPKAAELESLLSTLKKAA